MLSRKQFVRNLLLQGLRALAELNLGNGNRNENHGEQLRRFDLPLTELSPSLLKIEAERLGIPSERLRTVELRRWLYQELAKDGPNLKSGKAHPM